MKNKSFSKTFVFVILLTALFLCSFVFAACGETAGDNNTATGGEDNTDSSPAPTPEPTPEPTTPEPTQRPTRPPPPVFDELVIVSCDTLDFNKLGSRITLTTDDPAPELSSSWFSPGGSKGPGDVIFQIVINPIDVTRNDYMTGAIKVWIWCNDLDGLGTSDSQFEFCTKTNDTQENNWNWRDQIETEGWNAVYLPWEDARESDPEPDNTSLTWIRIYSVGRTADFKLGQISLVPYNQIP